MTDSLYDALGVPPDAGADEIKRAYQKGISKAHPDRGGDPTTALALNEAWRVLGDEELRRRYDTTGRVESEAQRANHLAAELMNAFLIIAEHSASVAHVHLFDELRQALRRAIVDQRQNIKAANGKRNKAAKILERVTRKGAGENIFATGLRNVVQSLERECANREQAITDKQDQLAMLDDYEYRVDEAPNGIPLSQFAQMFTTGTAP